MVDNGYVVGTKQVKRALSKNQVMKVYLAEDANSSLVNEIKILCDKQGVEVEFIDKMKRLGEMYNIDVKAASVAILK